LEKSAGRFNFDLKLQEMILMSKNRLINLVFVVCLLAFFAGCSNDETPSGIDVSGNWQAQIAVQTCSPTDLCSSLGLLPGANATAIMTLTQNGTHLEGTYTYSGAGVSANVSGQIAGNQVVLDGTATHPLGQITVHLTGTAQNNQIAATVTHQVTVIDGRTGSISGNGTFTH
jgi:hypothetical protein